MATQDLYESAEQLAKAANDTLQQIYRQRRGNGLWQRSKKTGHGALEQSKDWSHDASEYAREHPAATIGVAIGIAAVIYAIVSLLRR